VARGRGAEALRLARGRDDRAAEPLVPPALQHRHDARALPRVQGRGRGDPQRAGRAKAWISRRLGGDQIDYADERPEIRGWFSEALAKHGLEPNMEKAYEAENQTVREPRGKTAGKQGQTTF